MKKNNNEKVFLIITIISVIWLFLLRLVWHFQNNILNAIAQLVTIPAILSTIVIFIYCLLKIIRKENNKIIFSTFLLSSIGVVYLLIELKLI